MINNKAFDKCSKIINTFYENINYFDEENIKFYLLEIK